jgi:hypothetical protein
VKPRAFRGYRRARRLLERYCRLGREVRVEFVPRLAWWADASREYGARAARRGGVARKYRTHYLIRLSMGLSADAALEVFAHEWAHCRAWDKSRIDHGSKWGIDYARCYRVLVDGWRPKR